jgi:hypothetical protein
MAVAEDLTGRASLKKRPLRNRIGRKPRARRRRWRDEDPPALLRCAE